MSSNETGNKVKFVNSSIVLGKNKKKPNKIYDEYKSVFLNKIQSKIQSAIL
jgi:hypothetical protein